MHESPPSLSSVVKAWYFLGLLVRPKVARKLGTIATEGYLHETGWVQSVMRDAVVDTAGEPQPWTTQPFTDFIAPRLREDWTVFEYGAGASTVYYARRVARVTAVEHDEEFAVRLRAQLPQNAEVLVCRAESNSYARMIAECASRPHLVSVDGENRVACVEAALQVMSPLAVLVLDDAERPEYAVAHRLLGTAGYRAVEFWGLPPGGVARKCTSVFYRAGNVLGL